MKDYKDLEKELEEFLAEESEPEDFLVEDKKTEITERDDDTIEPKPYDDYEPYPYPYPAYVLPEKPKKTLGSLMSNILFYGVLIAIIAAAVSFSAKKSGVVSILGYSPMIVVSGSMEPEIPLNAFIIAKETEPKDIKIGDDITFLKNEKTTFTHRVIDKYDPYKDSGEIGFKTQGIANKEPDDDVVLGPNVVGVVKLRIPAIGFIISWVKSRKLLAGMLVLLIAGIIYALKKYSEADQAEKHEQEYRQMSEMNQQLRSRQRRKDRRGGQ